MQPPLVRSRRGRRARLKARRWLDDPQDLDTILITDIILVALTGLMWSL